MKSPMKRDPDHQSTAQSLPQSLTQRTVSIDAVLLSNHHSVLGLPYLTRTAQKECTFNENLDNLHRKSHREELLNMLLSTEPITMRDIASNLQSESEVQREDPSVRVSENESNDNEDSQCIEIVLSSHCTIYATEPTKQYGKLLMKSLASSNGSLFVRDHGVNEGRECLYDMDEVEQCITRISTVQYNERCPLIPGGELDVICISSGLYIGSSNWILCGSAMALSMAIVVGFYLCLFCHFHIDILSVLLLCDHCDVADGILWCDQSIPESHLIVPAL